MPRDEVVLVKCRFTRGGFPTELVFHVAYPAGGELSGIAPREYCFNKDKRPFEKRLARGQEEEGYVVGLVVGPGEGSGVLRVNLPDNDIYEVEEGQLIRNGDLADVCLQP
jgi:hypothetical protein